MGEPKTHPNFKILPDGDLEHAGRSGQYTKYYRASGDITLDGHYTIDQLEYIIEYMKQYEEL